MASEIDEAAAVEWFGEPEEWFSSSGRNAARAALAWKARAEERLNQAALDWRGINTPCGDCGGRGSKAYPNSAGWAGGIGGQAMTSGVCDKCWGSGDAEKTWANLRHVSAHIEQATRELDVALARAEQLAASEAERDAAIARAEAAEAELESLKNLLVSAIYSPKDRDRIGEAVLNVLASYRARCEAAEYAKDVAYRVQDMAIEKVERLCDLADEKATLMNEWGIETDKSLTECFLRNVWGWKDRALEAEKLASDYETKIGAEMPPDFKDWHQNSPLERPLVAALSLRSLRKRLEHEEETVDRLVGEIDALKKGNAVTE